MNNPQGENKEKIIRRIYLPNEIFADLLVTEFKFPSHIAFAYSYLYYVTYLYRYAIYGVETERVLNQQDIKEDIGISGINKQVDYIVKKGGVLDRLGYTRTMTDYPVSVIREEVHNTRYTVDFELKSQKGLDERERRGTNFRIKYPVKSFYRSQEDENDGYMSGTFYDISNTHGISIDIFFDAVQNKEIGYEGFYLFSFLKYKNDTHSNSVNYNGGYSVSVEPRLVEMTGLKKDRIYTLNTALEKNGFIKIIREKAGKYNNPNTYIIERK